MNINNFSKKIKYNSVGWLLISSILGLIGGLTASWINYTFKKQEIINQVIADLNKDRSKLNMEEEKARQERVRKEVIRWANPIKVSVDSLEKRLNDIVNDNGYLALDKDCKNKINPNWSITYEYYIPSTLFLFAQYFGWVQLIKEELSYELVQSKTKEVNLLDKFDNVSHALSAFPPRPKFECKKRDLQIFTLQQRAIADLMLQDRGNGSRTCISYPEFLKKMKDPSFSAHFKSLLTFVDNLNPSDDCRWKRMGQTLEALKDLQDGCNKFIDLNKNSLEVSK